MSRKRANNKTLQVQLHKVHGRAAEVRRFGKKLGG